MVNSTVKFHSSRYRLLFTALILGGIAAIFSLRQDKISRGPQDASHHAPPAAPIALLELFEPEQCVNCAEAEVAIAEVSADYNARGQAVNGLIFRGGRWQHSLVLDPNTRDPALQRIEQHYSIQAGLGSAQPGRLLINGEHLVPAAERTQIYRRVEIMLATPAPIGLSLRDLSSGPPQTRAIIYVLSQPSPGLVLNLAFAEPATASGDHGADLNYIHTLVSQRLDEAGEGVLTLPRDVTAPASFGRVIGFVQDPNSLRIVAAARLDTME